jgi:RNA-directed DNA polymerase
MPKVAPVNTGASDVAVPQGSWSRVSGMQAKLHRWAAADPGRRFDDLFNFVCDPATLIVAFDRVAGNTGANTPGVDGLTVADVEASIGAPGFLNDLRTRLRDGRFRPLPARERKIPKPGGSGKLRRLGIPTIADRVVQAALKLVLEPIFEADFEPVSYGFRPKRRAHDAIAEIQRFGTTGYRWVLDADIEACFDSISHTALIDRVRMRVKDKRVLALVKAFLKAGVLTELGEHEDSPTGTPQGGILSPLLANIALSALDEHVHGPWRLDGSMSTPSRRARRRRKNLPNWRIVRYADDFVVLVHGERGDVEALREDIANVLAPLGLRLSEAKTQVVHMSDGFDFLGFHIQWPQARHEQKARLHLHRRPAHPVGEGQDPCPDQQVVAAAPQGRADQAQPDHARLGQLLPARSLQTHHERPRELRVVEGDPLVDEAAPLELEGRPSTLHRPCRSVAQTLGGRDRAVQHRLSPDLSIPVPRQQDPQALDRAQPRLTADTVESPLPRDRHGGFGERPGETDREQSRHRAPGRLNQTPSTGWIRQLSLPHALAARHHAGIDVAGASGYLVLSSWSIAALQPWG